jgi:alkylation response protein AidB-like acyl-CoA dehydrogenase
LDLARVGVAAEALGLVQSCFDIILEQLKTRVQFGRTLGSFQALQHRAAYLFTKIEVLKAVVAFAFEEIDRDMSGLPQTASLTKTIANDTVHLVTREMIQILGGIGMTDAHDAGLYLKRAVMLEASWGQSSFLTDRFAALLRF